MTTNSPDKNGTFEPWIHTSFNQTLLLHQKAESITGKKLKYGHHPHQKNIRVFEPKSPTSFNQTSFRPKKLEVISAEKMSISRNLTVCTLDQNNTGACKSIVCVLFDQTSSPAKEPEANTADQTPSLMNGSILNNTVQQECYSTGIGGAIYAGNQTQLVIRNCVFKDNSAPFAVGVIFAEINVTLDVQETTFIGNKALVLQGGAIVVQLQAHLQIINCTFKDNRAEDIAGAVCGNDDAQRTSFIGNSAQQGGAIDVQRQAYLHATDCTFIDNHAGQVGGAICEAHNAVLDIQSTYFTGNRASESGAIHIAQQGYLRATNCTFIDNHAEQIGGVTCGSYEAALDITDTNFTGNSAVQGGAINVQHQANLSLTNCRLDRNFASDFGGAILVKGDVTLEIQETNASIAAGALFASQSQCHVLRSVFHSNIVKAMGGAVFIQVKSSLKMENTTFKNNKGSDGGAINIESSSKLQVNMCIFWGELCCTVWRSYSIK